MSTFADAAHAIDLARAAWWGDLRAFNRATDAGTATGDDAAAILARSNELDADTEQLRRKFYPRAHRLIIGNGTAITVSKTGRSTKQVWEAPASHTATDE